MTGGFVLLVDLSNKSAQVIDTGTDTAVRLWSGVTRRTAVTVAEEDGWVMVGAWRYTSPPDGFWRRVEPGFTPE